MVIYSVLEPPDAPADRLESAEELVFVRDGFSFYAAALPPVWMLVKRMWLELAIYMGAAGLIAWAASSAGQTELGNAILLAVQIIFGFESGALHSASLERRGWRPVGTVSGRNREDCERRFLEVWLPTRTEIPRPAAGSAPVAAAPPSWMRRAFTQAKDAILRGPNAPADSKA